MSPSLCSQEPRTGEGGAAPTSLCTGGGLGVPPAAFGGLEGRAGSCRGRRGSPHGGSSKRTRWNSSSWTPAHSGPTVPQPPCKCKSCRRSQPSNLGGVWGRDLCPGETCPGHPPLVCMDCDHPLDMDLSHGSTFSTSAVTGVVAPGVRAQAGTQILCAVTHPHGSALYMRD